MIQWHDSRLKLHILNCIKNSYIKIKINLPTLKWHANNRPKIGPVALNVVSQIGQNRPCGTEVVNHVTLLIKIKRMTCTEYPLQKR